MAVAGVTGVPATLRCPASGASSPRIRRSSVDFPQPLGPRSASEVRASTVSVVGARTSLPPKRFSTPSRVTMRA